MEFGRDRNVSATNTLQEDVEADPLVDRDRSGATDADADADAETTEGGAKAIRRTRRFRLLNWRNTSLVEARLQSIARQPGFILAILGLMLIVIVVLSLRVPTQNQSQAQALTDGVDLGPDGKPLIPFNFDTLNSGLFSADLASRKWVKGAPDGSYLLKESDSSLVIHHVNSKEKTVLAAYKDLVIDQSRTPLQYTGFEVSPSVKHVLFESNIVKGWRHSFFATYHIFDVEKKTLKVLAASTPSTVGSGVANNGATDTQQHSRAESGQASDNEEVLGKGKVALAIWAPNGNSVAWVRDNDIYVTSVETNTEVQITTDGSFDIMNGIADWVYEEEVYGGNQALWFSPDASKLAYLKFNDAKVPSYNVQMFFGGSGGDQQYPEEISIKYPKAGTTNPVATLHISNPSAPSASSREIPINFSPPESLFPDDDRLIVEVKWMADSDSLMVRMMNRVQDHQRLYIVTAPTVAAPGAQKRQDAGSSGGIATPISKNGTDVAAWTALLVRDEKSRDEAWLTTQLQAIHVLPISKAAARSEPQYLEHAEDERGFMHIAYYDSIMAKSPVTWLTTGDFEVAHVVHVDTERNVVYYTSTAKGSMQRHLYSVKIKKDDSHQEEKLTPPKGITWTSSVRSFGLKDATHDANSGIGLPVGETGWYDASFSSDGGYYLLTYRGPDVPFQKIISLYDTSIDFPFKTNEVVANNLKAHAMPKQLFLTIPLSHAPGIDVNAQLIVPNSFDPSDKTKKYPMLIKVYGGPNSQTVREVFNLEFETALSAEGYIILVVDPRGTCCKGRGFRAVVSKQLGKLEASDVVDAASYIVQKGFVDPAKVAIWGWSYGGFLSSKVIESNSGVINTGIAVAPVTDWKFYDSVYTERYMKTPLMNPKGYETSAVANMTGFKNADFLLIHGTGDDNVHFQNSLSLIWKLTSSQVHRYQVQFYPDSDHSMSAGNAFWELFDLLHRFLDGKFGVNDKTTGGVEGNLHPRDLEMKSHGVVEGLGVAWDRFKVDK
ncbi:hypothetical protein HDU78_001415 [Chytriomyces hyalinus]|nr:hypothetical protein HDU78_001415 [Chytriomyces hyalinus]